MLKKLSIDIETKARLNLKVVGLYRYVECPEFAITLFSYSYNHGKVKKIDLTKGERIPAEVLEDIQNDEVIKAAWNANFERVCVTVFFKIKSNISGWSCTMVKAAMLGLPLDLKQASVILNINHGKLDTGAALINYFTKPCKPTKTNGFRDWNLPEHAPEKWEQFGLYNIRDVEAENEIDQKISYFELPAKEKKLYILDQEINDRGVKVDLKLAKSAIEIGKHYKDRKLQETIDLTGLTKPNSPIELIKWLSGEMPLDDVTSLKKELLPGLIESSAGYDNAENIKRVIEIRQEISKTSIKKFNRILSCVCNDLRVKGLFAFYAANRTGRWAGRGVQVHNLKRNKMELLELARKIARNGEAEKFEMFFDVQDTLSQLIRPAFIPEKDHTFLITDFTSIEAIILAYLAGEIWRLDVFNNSIDIYKASASQAFNIALEDINDDYRFKGKVMELALGYQGGVGAMKRIPGAVGGDKGLKEDELPTLVKKWRKANPNIVKYWYHVGDMIFKTVDTHTKQIIGKGVYSYMKRGTLFISLPSGRKLAYQRAHIGKNHFNRPSVVYYGMDQTTKRWKKIESYGGKFVENIVQAIARDCLGTALLRINAAGFRIVMHVHDEIVIEILKQLATPEKVEEINAIMAKKIKWAKDLPLSAKSYISPFYKKD